jgi:hypothetical protein
MKPWVAVLGGVWLASCSGGAEEPPPAGEVHLRCAGPLDSRFLHLQADGRFQFYFRAHFKTSLGLEGTWRRTGPDAAALRCEHWSRQVVCDPFRVRFGSQWADHRRLVRDGILAVLRDHPGQVSFGRQELEDAVTWDEERPLVTGPELVTVLPLSVLEESVPRGAVERLLGALDDYEKSGDPREVHIRLHRHRGVEFVEWLDWSAYEDPVSPAAVRAEIEQLESGETLADVWVVLGKAAFERELFQGQSFKFFKRPGKK